ncbi:MAG: hypothetical protein ACTTKH_03855 [Treponema sp.]
MQNRKHLKMIVGLVIAFITISCNNTYNTLIPNDEQNILEFSLSSEDHKTRSVSSEIKENYITVKVPKGTDIAKLFPKAMLPKQAILFPLTLKYLQEAFPRTDVLDMALKINPAKKGLENWFLGLYEENPDFSIPPLVFPINFLYPVKFVVIGGQGGVEIYTVKVIYDDGSAPSVEDLPDPNLDESKKILSFYVPDKQKGSSVITHNTIEFTCNAGVDVRNLLPEITVEKDAIAIPLTKEYLFEASSKLGIDPLSFAQGFMDAANKRAYLSGILASCDTSSLSIPINKAMDFTNPIQIVVLGTLSKSVRLYTATASLDQDEAYLKRIVFTKAKNPNLIKDYIGEVFQEEKTIDCTLYYPVDSSTWNGEFNLFLDAQYTGTNISIEYNGETYPFNKKIPFKPIKTSNEHYLLGTARAKVHVDNGAVRKTYTLKLTFKEDPDTIRSITDFRFEARWNKIKATAIASITHQDDVGTITATVLYSGELPDKLLPSIVTGGGKILVGGKNQLGERHSRRRQDFSNPIEYVCVSKDGNYERVYTVKVEFIKVEHAEVALKSFKFPLHLNKEISQDAIGIIDEAHSTVSVDVVYDGTKKPFELVSEFSATGRVSIEGITQSTGFSTQNYKYDVYLKVTALDDENVNKTYRVHVTYKYSTENKAQLLRFYFEKEKNPSLKSSIECYISTSSYHVYAVLPKECDVANLVPSFEAEGSVKVAGVEQTSGASSQDFTNIVEYEVVSVNGQNSKTYKVKVQKRGDIIYLDPNARGKNNGTTWKDAFRKLEDAVKAANRAKGLSEIWATDKEFSNVKAKLKKAVSIIGGFKGGETSKTEREEWSKTRFNNVSFGGSHSVEGALVFDRISFYGNKDLFINRYDQDGFSWEEDTFRDNSITFEKCQLEGISIYLRFGSFQKIKIKDSDFGKSVNIQTEFDFPRGANNASFSTLGLEMEIENSKFLSDINNYRYNEYEAYSVNLLKVKDSTLSTGFRMMANNVEFENVKEEDSHAKVTLYNVSEKAIFKNVKLSNLSIESYKRGEYGSFSFNNCEISNLNFNEENEYSPQEYKIKGELEFKDCEHTYVGFKRSNTDSYFNKLTVEGGAGFGGSGLNVKDIKIKDDKYAGNIFIKSCADGNTEISNLKADKLVITGGGSGVQNIKDSRFGELEIVAGKEIFLKNIEGYKHKEIIKCESDVIEASGIKEFKKGFFCAREKINLNKFSIDNYIERLDLLGKNVSLKDTEIIHKNSEVLIRIAALENFDFDIDERLEKSTLVLLYPKAYNFNGKNFSHLQLDGKGYSYGGLDFPDPIESITFTNCKFFTKLHNYRNNTIIDSCEFIGENKVNFYEGSIGSEIKNVEKKLGKLEVNAFGNSQAKISNSHFEHTTFNVWGTLFIESSSFKNIEKFSSWGRFDISNCQFEIDDAVLETDIWFEAESANIKDSTFEKKYIYAEHAKARILLDTKELKLKNTKFINSKSMCNVCIKASKFENETTIEDCTFVDAGRIYVRSYKNLLVKNSIIHGTMLDLVVMGDDNVNYTSSSKTLFENCDFFDQAKPSIIKLSNYISSTSGGNDFHNYQTAVRFEYDMSKIPADLRNKIGSLTPQQISNMLKPFITGSTNRVGYFINLGNDAPSNSHPAKFLGNYD